jgi:hypothetical protein
LTGSFFLAQGAAAQGQPRPHFRAHPFGGHPGSPAMNPARQRFNQLSPEERQVFRRNAERWLKMNPEQQKALREREQVRRAQMKAEAETVLHQMGLRLDSSAQGQFEARYMQERRRMERQLRQETEARRQQQLPQLNERLKNEFQTRPGNGGNQAGSPAVSPADSAKP